MAEKTRRGAMEGVGFGLLAGIVFAVAEIVGATLMGNEPIMLLRAFASIVMGESALQTASVGTAALLGIFVHLVLSALFGLIYGVVNANFSSKTETSWERQMGLGFLYGAILWLVNFQIIARGAYPWFLEMPQFYQMVMHALFYGLPLALMYAAAERRVQHVSPAHGHI